MDNKFLRVTQNAAITHRKKRLRSRILTILSAIVVFCTTYALILPAITMDSKMNLTCSVEELSIHTHSDECWSEGGKLLCGYADFVIHEHNADCIDKNGDLICMLPEIHAHQHSASCFAPYAKDSDENFKSCSNTEELELICSEDELYPHQHTEECFDESGNWICEQLQVVEHRHTEECFEKVDAITEEPVPAEPAVTAVDSNVKHQSYCMTHTGNDYSVSVFYTEDARLPENVELSVNEILPGNPAYEEYFQQTNELLSEEEQGLVFCRFFDISFISEGIEIEPAASVEVQVTYAESLPQDENALCNAVHFAENGVEVLPAEIQVTDDNADTFVFSQESFSVVGTAISALNLSSGSYIFYKDGYAIGAGYSALTPVAVTVDENGYVYPTNSSIPVDAITWTYSNYGLKSDHNNYYISLTSNGVALSYSASTVNARIINNAVRFSTTATSSGYGSTTYYLGFANNTYIAKSIFAEGDYFLAAKVVNVDDTVIQPGDLEIDDKIKQDGCLYPKLNVFVDSDMILTYAWYRSDDGGNSWSEVARTKVTGDSYNVAKDGSWLNVALDKGADTKYKVALVAINGSQCEPIVSPEYHIPYFDSIQNGDFENPVISTDVSDAEHYQPLLPNGTAGMVWKTTAGDGEIELISVASSTFKTMSTKWHNCESAAKGVQYAELNAGMAGSLYQDVLTTPGSNMYWSLAHRGRGKSSYQSNNGVSNYDMYDSMYVVIMSATLAEQYDITTQQKVNNVINNPDKYPGADVVKITDNAAKWYYHAGEYVVPDKQYLTRYFFVAGETYFDTSGDTSAPAYTVGNHLDDIYFSTELPPPSEGYGNLVIEKTIVGLDETSAKALLNRLNFSIKGNSGTSDKQVSGSDFSNFARNADDSFTASYQQSIALGTKESIRLQICEDLASAEIDGYNRTETTVQINGAASEVYYGTDKDITIEEKNTSYISFVNHYTPQTTSLKLQKTDENGNSLTGASFALDMLLNDEWESVYDSIATDENGKAAITGLYYDKVYRITEIKAPAGYYMLTSPVYFKLLSANGNPELYPCDASGNIILNWPSQVSVMSENVIGLQIVNQQGMILPKTGGIGIRRIYCLGFGLVCIPVFFTGFMWRKKKKGGIKSNPF